MSFRAQQDLSKRCAVSAWSIGMRLNQRNRAAGIRVFEVPDQDTLCAAGLCHGVDLWKDRYDCTRGGHKPNGSQACAFLFIQYPPPLRYRPASPPYETYLYLVRGSKTFVRTNLKISDF